MEQSNRAAAVTRAAYSVVALAGVMALYGGVGAGVAHGQVVLDETFDDGAAAGRFTYNQRLNAASNTPTINYAFDFSGVLYDDYSSGSVVQKPIPSAPGSTSKIALKMQVSGSGSHIAVTPTGLNVTGDFRIEGYTWANYNGGPGDGLATMGGTGSSEYLTVGLNRSGNTGVAGIFPTGTADPGYDFGWINEGGQASDFRVTSSDAGDDGAGYPKRNAAWVGAVTENRFNLSTGELIGTSLVRDLPDNHANSYYRTEVFPSSGGFEIAGAPAKQWVPFVVEQRGRVTTFALNGKIINVLFNAAAHSGTPQFGYADRNASQADPALIDKQFALFDNIKVTQLADAPQNSFSADDYAEFTTPGNYTATAGGAVVRGLVIDPANATDSVNFAAGSPITFSGINGALLASKGTHTFNNAVTFNADTAIMTGAGGTNSTVADPTVVDLKNATFGAGVDVSKLGLGTLKLNRLRAKSLTNASGAVVITGAGPANAGKITGYDTYDVDSSTVFGPGATLDIGRTVMAYDYVARTSSTTPTLTNSPLTGTFDANGKATQLSIAGLLTSGYAADANGLPTWTGRGIISSAPEIVGTGYATSQYIIRLAEASALGYTDGSTWGSTGLTIDASTVLFGFTFKADTDLDQDVDFGDLLTLAKNYNQTTDPTTGLAFAKGDADNNGKVEFADLLALAKLYNQKVGAAPAAVSAEAFAADWALAQSLVPEPTSLGVLLGLGGIAMRRRRGC